MAYDRYETRRDWREARPRWRDEDRFSRSTSGYSGRDRDDDERGWFERAGDEIASWFGDEETERRRRRGDFGRDRASMSDDDFGRFERSPRWRDEGYRRPYTGRFTGRQEFGPDRGRGGFDERLERGGSYYGVGAHHDRHYGEWRARQLDELDRDYEDYARENRKRFEDDFTSWREQRQGKRQLLRSVREQMEVVGSDGEHVGTVDRTAGDRLILTRSDPESGGAHHSLMCTSIDRVEGDKVILGLPAEEAKKQWRDDSRERALFEREDQGEAGPHILGRSFSGTY